MKNIRVLTARAHRLEDALAEELKEHRLHDRQILLLVPEQMTVSAEEMVMTRLQLSCLIGIDVISPTKLYDTLMHYLGRDEREPLTDMGYRMAVGQTLENMEGKLSYFRGSNCFSGMVERLSDLLMNLKRCGLDGETLMNLSRQGKNDLQRTKFADLALIEERYEALLNNRFHDSEDRMGYLASRMGDCSYMKGKILYIHGFDTITEQLSRIAIAAAALCDEVNIILTCDFEKAGDQQLYLPIRESINRMYASARKEKIGVEVVQLPNRPLDSTPEIRHLDENLFAVPCKSFSEKVNSIGIFFALNPYEEATVMSRQILACMEEGFSPNRIVVLTPNSSTYDFAVSAALSDAGLSFCLNKSLKVTSHNLVRFLLLSLRAMEGRWPKEEMLALLQNPYVPLVYEERCQLRSYACACGIQKDLWEKEFTRGEKPEAEICEVLRQQFMKPLQACRSGLLQAKTARDSIRAVYQYLLETECYDGLCREIGTMFEAGMLTRSEQCLQIWDTLMTLMDDMIRLERDKRIPLNHIADRFENALSGEKLATLPPAGAVIQTGKLGHMIVEEADVVFILGMNDGVLGKENNGLLSPEDMEYISQTADCYLGASDISLSLLAKLDLKKAMTLPRKKLFISYSETDMDGNKLEPLGELAYLNKTAFGMNIPVNPSVNELPLSSRQAEMQLVKMDEDVETLQTSAWQAVLRSLEGSGNASLLGSVLNYSLQADSISRADAQMLYGHHMSVSVLEEYAWCKYRHFIRYALRPAENKQWEFDFRLGGNYSHSVLNRFSLAALKEKQYPHIDEGKLDELVNQALEETEARLREDIFHDGFRNEAKLQSLRSSVKRSIHQLTRQLAEGTFRLVKTEAAFGQEGNASLPPLKLKLEDGESVELKGFIDRIDTCKEAEETFMRVIDYKSSEHVLNAGRIALGVQLQLLLYQSVCEEIQKNTVPAGAFYFHIQDPMVKAEEDTADKNENDLYKAYSMKGISLKEAEAFAADPGSKPPYAGSESISRNDMDALLRYTRSIAEKMAKEMLSGHIDIIPAKEGTVSACDYCLDREICKRDEDNATWRFSPQDFKMSDLLEQLNASPENSPIQGDDFIPS